MQNNAQLALFSTLSDFTFDLSFSFVLFQELGCCQLHHWNFERWMSIGAKKTHFLMPYGIFTH